MKDVFASTSSAGYTWDLTSLCYAFLSQKGCSEYWDLSPEQKENTYDYNCGLYGSHNFYSFLRKEICGRFHHKLKLYRKFLFDQHLCPGHVSVLLYCRCLRHVDTEILVMTIVLTVEIHAPSHLRILICGDWNELRFRKGEGLPLHSLAVVVNGNIRDVRQVAAHRLQRDLTTQIAGEEFKWNVHQLCSSSVIIMSAVFSHQLVSWTLKYCMLITISIFSVARRLR